MLVANDVFGENRYGSIRDGMSFLGIVFVSWFFHLFHELSMSNKFAINVRSTSRTPYGCQEVRMECRKWTDGVLLILNFFLLMFVYTLHVVRAGPQLARLFGFETNVTRKDVFAFTFFILFHQCA